MATDSKVFISYASDTKPLAEELTRALESHDIQAWVDFKDLLPGQNFNGELDRAVSSSQWLLFLIGPNSRATRRQETEWQAALASSWKDSGKKMLPILVGGAEPPPFLRTWVPLKVDPVTEPATWTKRVLDVLRSPNNRKALLSSDDLRERQQRFAEIGRAAEVFRQLREQELPANLKGEASH